MTTAQIQGISKLIYEFPQLRGARVGFYGEAQCQVIQQGVRSSGNYRTIVLIEEKEITTNRFTGNSEVAVADKPEIILNESRFWSEARGAGISCTLAAFAFSGATAGAAAIIPSGGTSVLITAALWTGFGTQAIQCLNGLYRAGDALANPNSNSLQKLDEHAVYSIIMPIIDATSVVAGLTTVAPAALSILKLLRLKGAFPSSQALKFMSKRQKIEAYETAVRKISANPADNLEYHKLLKELPGRTATKLSRMKPIAIKNGIAGVSEKMMTALTTSVKNHLTNQWDFYAGSVANALPQQYVGSASGVLNGAVTLAEKGIDHLINKKQKGIYIHIISE
jgi:hypothetical protein